MSAPLLSFKPEGIYCEQAGVYIDPWRPVNRAIVTHAHADHSRWGMKHYLAHHDSVPVMKHRLGEEIKVEGVAYGEKRRINGVEISLHPAGHIVGSAQVRVAYQGDVWVVSGDYKTQPDPTCTPFEPVPCHAFITESTFGLPVYRWKPETEVATEINAWWQTNASEGKASLLMGYALGKAQRLLSLLSPDIGPIYTHGAVENTNQVLDRAGLPLPETIRITSAHKKEDFRQAIIVAPPSAAGSPWIKKFHPYSIAIASGWMALRGTRRRRNVDRGFVLSDHADWNGLNQAIDATGASKIFVTHGYSGVFSQWLQERGFQAEIVQTEFEGELGEIGEGSEKEKEEEA